MEGDGILWGTLAIIKHFNPLPPHGGRLRLYWIIAIVVNISIHSLRMEGDESCGIRFYHM